MPLLVAMDHRDSQENAPFCEGFLKMCLFSQKIHGESLRNSPKFCGLWMRKVQVCDLRIWCFEVVRTGCMYTQTAVAVSQRLL